MEEIDRKYTGLTDKNGRSIYEGDIIKYLDMLFVVELDIYGILFLGNGEEKYWNRVLPYAPYEEHYITDTGNYEVVGNIYDNSNLLVKE